VEVERVRRPFWMHQVVEYLIGLALISFAFQSPRPAAVATVGIVIVLNAALSGGAAGAFRLLPQRLHRVIDVVVMVVLLVLAVQPWIDLDLTSRLVIGGIVFVLFFVWFHTDFAPRLSRAQRRAARASGGRPEERPVDSTERGRRAGRFVGESINAVRRWGKDDESP
jgi:hypothetical protein